MTSLLECSRSTFTRISLTDVCLSERVETALEQVASDLQAARGSVRLLVEARLRCGSTLLTTLFHNMPANAIASRRRDRPLEVKINCVNEGGDWRITVEGNGAGFDPDFAAVAFNPLVRGVHVAGEGGGYRSRRLPQHNPEAWRQDLHRSGVSTGRTHCLHAASRTTARRLTATWLSRHACRP